MIVKFKVNLGSIDAKALDLDFKKCLVGESVECEERAGKWLVNRGIAVDVTPKAKSEPAPSPVAVQGVDNKTTNKLKT